MAGLLQHQPQKGLQAHSPANGRQS
jgi:hypothetical protein